LGATRWRIVRQLLIECVLLAMLSGIVGFGFSVYAVRLFAASFEQLTLGETPYWLYWTMDAYVVTFLVPVCLATSRLFGLAPALHISKTNVNDMLKEGGRTGVGG